MNTLELIRLNDSDDGMLGVLNSQLGQICYTLEQNWNGNIPFVSCIPAGEYQCDYLAKSASKRFRDCYWLKEVPGRSEILIHKGNILRDTSGCILPGITIGRLGRFRGVIGSSLAMRAIHGITNRESFNLIITDYVLEAKRANQQLRLLKAENERLIDERNLLKNKLVRRNES